MDDDTLGLLSMFQKMGTTDHDELMMQFQKIIPTATTELAHFFLEASSWNLQMAILSYIDHIGDQEKVSQQMAVLNRPKPSAVFSLKDDGVPGYFTDISFVKEWSVTNNGTVTWPEGCSLDFVGGDQLGGPQKVTAAALPPGVTTSIALNFRTPSRPGQYAGSWMMTTTGAHPMMFGEPIWVVVNVAQNPHSQIQAGWGGFGAIPPTQAPAGNDHDTMMG